MKIDDYIQVQFVILFYFKIIFFFLHTLLCLLLVLFALSPPRILIILSHFFQELCFGWWWWSTTQDVSLISWLVRVLKGSYQLLFPLLFRDKRMKKNSFFFPLHDNQLQTCKWTTKLTGVCCLVLGRLIKRGCKCDPFGLLSSVFSSFSELILLSSLPLFILLFFSLTTE